MEYPTKSLFIQTMKKCATDYFFVRNLDALFKVSNSLGSSAFNCFGRRVVLLIKELSGVLLEPEHLGHIYILKVRPLKQTRSKRISRTQVTFLPKFRAD